MCGTMTVKRASGQTIVSRNVTRTSSCPVNPSLCSRLAMRGGEECLYLSFLPAVGNSTERKENGREFDRSESNRGDTESKTEYNNRSALAQSCIGICSYSM